MVTLINAAYSLKLDKIGKKELRLMISLRKYIASQHKPNVTKCLTEYFGSEKMLDFSIGKNGETDLSDKKKFYNKSLCWDRPKKREPSYIQKTEPNFIKNILRSLRILQR